MVLVLLGGLRLALLALLLTLLTDVGCAKLVAILVGLGSCLGSKLLLGRGRDMESRVHAQGSLSSAGGRGIVGSLVALLSGLLESVEVGNIDAVSGGCLGGLDGALDVGCRVARGNRHVCGWRCSLGSLQRRRARLTLALLARRAGQGRQVRLLLVGGVTHSNGDVVGFSYVC